jgi:putative ABC transport system permease protein
MHDLRVSARLLWKHKTFTITAALTLAVCIGANVALFTVVDHVLLRPLRVPESDRVVLVYNSYPKAGAEHASATVVDYIERGRELTVFDEQALFNTRNPSLDLNGTPERIHAMQVTPSFFRLIRVPPRMGRGFTDDEGQLGKNHVVILSDGLRQQLFGDANAIGRDVRIDGEPHTVVGVMAADFTLIDSKVEAWLPLAFTDEQKTARYSNNWVYLGRLKRDASLAQVQAQIDALSAANLQRVPESKQVVETTGLHTVATLLQDDLVRDVRSTLYLLWGGALFVLSIGCVNVASLVLVRSRGRLKELATRMALGAGRWRIIHQLVIEHVLLTMVAAAAGLLIGGGALRLLGSMSLEDLPRAAEIRMDAVIVAYTLSIAAAIGIGLGAIPLIGGLPVNLISILREEGRGGTSGRGVRTMRRALVVTQVALAFLLLVGAGLLFASFQRVMAIDPGFNAAGVLTASVNLPAVRYPLDGEGKNPTTQRFTDEALRAIRSVPGVVAAGATTAIPFGDEFSQDVIFPEGYRLNPGDSLVALYRSNVTPGYFEVMGVRLIGGRFFDERDRTGGPRVVIVDERLARRFWPGVNPVGRRMFEPESDKDVTAITDKTSWYTVVGVVGEVKLRGLVEGVGETGAYYYPQAQSPSRRLTFTIRTSTPPESIANAVRAAVARIDRELPVFDVLTMAERTDRSLTQRRSPMLLAMVFGFVALFLAAIGIYGVLAYLVTQRTKEIGIRMALGSSKRAVFQLILREGVLLIVSGFLLGAAGALALRRSLERELYGIRATDPIVLLLAVATLALVAVTACAIPARRATQINPAVALAE